MCFKGFAKYLHIFLVPCFSDVGDSPSEHTQEDLDSVYPSEDGKFYISR